MPHSIEECTGLLGDEVVSALVPLSQRQLLMSQLRLAHDCAAVRVE
jgi:hypothetical protein